MNTALDGERELTTVPLLNAVFCVDCEIISNSAHHACTVCGSRSLISLVRLFGGTLRGQKRPPGEQVKMARYNVEFTAKLHDIPANELGRTIDSITRLTEMSGEVECLHVNVECIAEAKRTMHAA